MDNSARIVDNSVNRHALRETMGLYRTESDGPPTGGAVGSAARGYATQGPAESPTPPPPPRPLAPLTERELWRAYGADLEDEL